MSLNCLTCSQLLQRTSSFGELFAEEEFKEICKQVDGTNVSENKTSSTTTTRTQTKMFENKTSSTTTTRPQTKVFENKTSSTTTTTRPQCDRPKGGPLAKLKADHRRTQSTGDVPYSGRSEPRLVRSSGMRRNWSFEDVPRE